MTRFACYSDVQALWGRRDLGAHLFPYVSGTYQSDPPDVHGGTVEYPTLSGLWTWVTGLAAHSEATFLVVTALSFLPVVVLTTLALQRMAGRRAWWFAASPPLALYAVYNWDLLPVLLTAVGILVVLRAPASWSLGTRLTIAGAAFGTGAAFKLYPALFAVVLTLAVLLGDFDTRIADRVRHAALTAGSALGVVLAANLPFALVNFEGWSSVFRFQAARAIDASTLSIWYYGLLPWSADTGERTQHLLNSAATGATALGIVTVLAVMVWSARHRGTVDWVGACGAALAVYMLCNKVDSLQYALWLLPFFTVLRVRTGWILAYLAADVAAFVGWYRSIYYDFVGQVQPVWADQALAVGVWGRAVLLACLVVVFLRSAVVRDDGGALSPAVDRGWTRRTVPTPAS
ncbi:glycosyltransferase 87 family protein [uncultured Curtobacterium sp.]|uniref:glycosyltransferase 87 family protein n=1 Tax=uncultured Curtobacterium sp. TaxID=331964 RepID=UPI00258AF0AB|nr:glycosyltransferase 87 family protein [uncultured Curtobacterium sp.]